MKDEELEHEHIREIAENYVNESWGSYLDLDEVDLVMAGIGVGKIIASEQEKRIADLTEQIEKMKCGGNCKHLYHVNTGGCYDAKCDLTYCDCTNCKDEWELRR